MTLAKDATCPTFKFDSIYSEIFSRSPDLMFIVKTQIIRPHSLGEMIPLLGLPFNYKVFQPFVDVLDVLELPFPDGDSPVDFLNDPRKAGNLYSDPRDITTAFVRLWFLHIKEDLLEGCNPPYL
jgi:hypothetical protein